MQCETSGIITALGCTLPFQLHIRNSTETWTLAAYSFVGSSTREISLRTRYKISITFFFNGLCSLSVLTAVLTTLSVFLAGTAYLTYAHKFQYCTIPGYPLPSFTVGGQT